jgi:hypothetical protein
MKNLKKALEFVGKNKAKPAIFVRTMGTVTFQMCGELIENGALDNEGNRDEDLDTHKKYWGKLHHLIRFISGISEKGQLLVSVLKDKPSKVGYIRDNGTMFSLAFGKYFDSKVITGNEWLMMCEDIIEHYDITNEDDKCIINMITAYFNTKTPQELDIQYSLKNVVDGSDEFRQFYNNSQIAFVVNLHTVKQFEKDMINCNRQPNAWLAYNFYMTPLKRTDEYKTYYCGDTVLQYFTNKAGTDIFGKGKLMYGHQGYADKHKVAKMIPILQAYIGSHYCETIDDFKKFNDMVVGFENGKDDGNETEYWQKMFWRVVSEVSYGELIKWYENTYVKVFESDDWKTITNTINKIVNHNLSGKKITAMDDLHIKKYHTGILLFTFVLYFKRTNKSVGLSKLTSKVVNEYSKLLNGSVNHEGSQILVWEYFGTQSSVYSSTSAGQRFDKLFKYVFQNVDASLKAGSKDRDLQAEYRDQSLTRMSSFLESEGIPQRLKLYPLSTDVLSFVNFKTGEGFQWLHKSPNSTGGDAKDGFLGMTDDNLTGNQKYKNWNCTPNEYWEMLADHNEKMSDNLSLIEKRIVTSSINTIYQILETGLNFGA